MSERNGHANAALNVNRYYLSISLKELAENIIKRNFTIFVLFCCQLPMGFTVNPFTYGIAFDCRSV